MDLMTEAVDTDDPPFHETADRIALGMAFQVVIPADGLGDRRFTYVAQSCQELNGVAAAAVLADARLFYDRFLPEHRRRLASAEARAAARLEPYDVEVALRRPDGEKRWHRITAAPRRTPDGATVWDGVQIDTTKRRRAEQAVEEQQRRLELAVEATGLGFWEWDLRSNRMEWSERQRQIFGVPPETPIDAKLYQGLIHPDDRERVSAGYFATHDNPQGGDFNGEYRIVLPDGAVRWVLTHGRVLADEGGPRLVVGTSLDVTERRGDEERRALVLRELAHRGKNGLSIMMAFISQAARSASSVEAFEATLISRLQAMAQAQDLVTESAGRPLHLPTLLTEVLKPFELQRFDLAANLDTVTLANEPALSLALLTHELATNAVKYGALSNAEGRISIESHPARPGMAAMCWREIGGPPVAEPGVDGFGSRLLKLALRHWGGSVEARLEPEGFIAVVEFPVAT